MGLSKDKDIVLENREVCAQLKPVMERLGITPDYYWCLMEPEGEWCLSYDEGPGMAGAAVPIESIPTYSHGTLCTALGLYKPDLRLNIIDHVWPDKEPPDDFRGREIKLVGNLRFHPSAYRIANLTWALLQSSPEDNMEILPELILLLEKEPSFV